MNIYREFSNLDVQRLDNGIKTQRAYQLFRNAIQNESTYRTYDHNLTKFLNWSKVPDYDTLANHSTDDIQRFTERIYQ